MLNIYYVLGTYHCEIIKNTALEKVFLTLLHLKCSMHYAAENSSYLTHSTCRAKVWATVNNYTLEQLDLLFNSSLYFLKLLSTLGFFPSSKLRK